MLNKQKHSKNTRGIRCDASKCSTRKDSSNKEILFISSSDDGDKKTFVVRSAPRKKIDLTTSIEDMKLKVATTKRDNVDPKGKGKLR